MTSMAFVLGVLPARDFTRSGLGESERHRHGVIGG